MIKTGKLTAGTSPCQHCGRPSTDIIDGKAVCRACIRKQGTREQQKAN